MRSIRGFTLVELMVTLAVISILAAIAYPSYQDQMRRGHRAQGQQFLLDIAQRQEQYFLDQRAYATALGTAAGQLNLPIPVAVSDKYQAPVFTINNAATPPTWLITLTPIVGGSMAVDGALVINNLQQTWRETDGNNTLGANDCRWQDSRCRPS